MVVAAVVVVAAVAVAVAVAAVAAAVGAVVAAVVLAMLAVVDVVVAVVMSSFEQNLHLRELAPVTVNGEGHLNIFTTVSAAENTASPPVAAATAAIALSYDTLRSIRSAYELQHQKQQHELLF